MERKFDYNTIEGVTAMLRSIERLRTLRLNGSLDAAIILVDVMDGLRRCGLSAQERVAVQHRYLRGLSQRQTAVEMGIHETTVSEYLSKAADKLLRVMAV